MESNFFRFFKELRDKKSIALYSSFKNEVATEGLFKELRRLEVTTVFPRVERKKHIMSFFIVNDISEMKPGTYAILEPPQDAKEVPISEIDLILVPGVAFDQHGYRLGYGQGYYDRVLKKTKTQKIGLAFEFQFVDALPHSLKDIPMDVIITEKKIWGIHS